MKPNVIIVIEMSNLFMRNALLYIINLSDPHL